MRQLIFTLFFFNTIGTAYSQADSVNLWINVTNKIENNSWFDNLVSENKKTQLKTIQRRLLSDSNILKTDTTSTIPYSQTQRLEINFYCRPLFKINRQDIFIENYEQANKLASIIGDINFTKIEILKADKAKEKYGKWGLCGVILLTTKDKKVNDRLRELGQ